MGGNALRSISVQSCKNDLGLLAQQIVCSLMIAYVIMHIVIRLQMTLPAQRKHIQRRLVGGHHDGRALLNSRHVTQQRFKIWHEST